MCELKLIKSLVCSAAFAITSVAGISSPSGFVFAATQPAASPSLDDLASIDAQLKEIGPAAAAKLSDPKVVDLLHRKAILLWNAGKQNDGRALLEKLAKATISNRSLMLNYAKADVQGKDAMRASLTMEHYFDLRPKGAGVDMEAFTLFGLAMWRVPNDKTIPQNRIDKYDALKEEVERTKPGQRLWGTEWVKQIDYERFMARRTEGQSRIRSIRTSMRDVQARAKAAEAQRPIGFRADSGTNYRLEGAASEMRQLNNEMDAAVRALPQPTFRADLRLVSPIPELFPAGSGDVYGIPKPKTDAPLPPVVSNFESGTVPEAQAAPPAAAEPNVELDERFSYRVPRRLANGQILVPTGAFILTREKIGAGRVASITIGPRIDEMSIRLGDDITITFNTVENPNQFTVEDRAAAMGAGIGRVRNNPHLARLNPREPNKITIELTDKKLVLGLNDAEIYTQQGNFAQLKVPLIITAGGDIAKNFESLLVTDLRFIETQGPLPF